MHTDSCRKHIRFLWQVRQRLFSIRLGLLFVLSVCLLSCTTNPPPPGPEAHLPQVYAQPASGVFPVLPQVIVLRSSPEATIYYTRDGSRPTVDSAVYRDAIALRGSDVILRVVACTAAGTCGREQVERYRHLSEAPRLVLDTMAPLVLGPQQRAAVRWRCEERCGPYRVMIADGAQGDAVDIATGVVQDGQAMETSLDAAQVASAQTRVWIAVRNGAVSLPLSIDRQAPGVRAWPGGGTYGTLPRVALVTDEEATVYYTTDGTVPTPASLAYKAPVHLDGKTTLHFLAVDRFGNQSTVQQEVYNHAKRAPTVRVQRFPGFALDVRHTLRVSWRSSHHGRYVLSANDQPLLRGRVQRHTDMHSTVHGWSLRAPHTRLRLQVTTDNGQEGSLSWHLDTLFRETFSNEAAVDGNSTTAALDVAAGRVMLPVGPFQSGVYETPRSSRGVAAQGHHVYLANTQGGLQVVDVTTPEQPHRRGSLFPYGEPKALAKSGNYLYVAADRSGLQIFDVSKPQRPLLVGQLPLKGQASAVTIQGDKAYVGTQQHGLLVYDLADPRQPAVLAHVPLAMPVMHLAATSTHVYIAGFDTGVGIVDLTTATKPRLVTTIPTQAVAGAALGVAVDRGRLYVAANALLVFDIHDVTQPRRLARVPLQSAHGLAMGGGMIYVAEQYQGLRIIDTTGPHPRVVGTYDTPNRAVRLTVQGDVAYVADVLGGLHSIDVSQPAQPVLLKTLSKLGQIVDVWVEDGLAYMVNRKGRNRVLIADVRQPRQARMVGRYGNGSLIDVALAGTYAYALDAFGGLQVVDISAPHLPVVVGAQHIPGVGQSVTLYGRHALIAAGEAGVHIIDVARARQPQRVARLDVHGESVDIVTWGPFAYVAAGAAGLAVLDLHDPSAPRVLGYIPTGDADEEGKIVRVAVGDERLYASSTAEELLVFSLTTPETPQLVQRLASPQGTLWTLALHGRLLYGTTILKHLTIFDVSQPDQVRVRHTAVGGGRDMAIMPPYLVQAAAAYKRRGGGLRLVNLYATIPLRLSPLEPRAAFDLTARGSHLYMASGDQGLRIGRLVADGAFQQVGRITWQDTAHHLALCGPYAYITGKHTLAVIDIAAPNTPRLLSTRDLGTEGMALACHGARAFVASSRGLLLVHTKNPTQLVVDATLDAPGTLRHLTWWQEGRTLLGATDTGQLLLYDVSTPQAPRVTWHVPLPGAIRDLAVAGTHAYAAAEGSGLYAMLLSDTPPKPQQIRADDDIAALTFWGEHAYMVDTHQELSHYDLTTPYQLRRIASLPLPFPTGTGVRLVAHDTLLVLARGAPGFHRIPMARSRTSVRVPQARVQSLKADMATQPVVSATLTPLAWTGIDGTITYELTNDGGDTWHQVVPGVPYAFPAPGQDLRWRALLHGDTTSADPALYAIRLTHEVAPAQPAR